MFVDAADVSSINQEKSCDGLFLPDRHLGSSWLRFQRRLRRNGSTTPHPASLEPRTNNRTMTHPPRVGGELRPSHPTSRRTSDRHRLISVPSRVTTESKRIFQRPKFPSSVSILERSTRSTHELIVAFAPQRGPAGNGLAIFEPAITRRAAHRRRRLGLPRVCRLESLHGAVLTAATTSPSVGKLTHRDVYPCPNCRSGIRTRATRGCTVRDQVTRIEFRCVKIAEPGGEDGQSGFVQSISIQAAVPDCAYRNTRCVPVAS